MARGTEKPIEVQTDPAPTPAPAPVKDKTGVHDARPRSEVVGDYPERPYSEAISDSHREFLASKGLEVK